MLRDANSQHPAPAVLLGLPGLALGALLYGASPTHMASLDPGTAGQLLKTGGAGAAPSWSNLADGVTAGVLTIAKAGTTARTLTAPDASGTIALTSDLPTLSSLGLAGLATSGITGTLTLAKTGTTPRTITFQDAAGTVAFLSDITSGLAGLATSGITGDLTLTKTGTTARTVTFQDAAYTVAGTDVANAFSANQALTNSVAGDASFIVTNANSGTNARALVRVTNGDLTLGINAYGASSTATAFGVTLANYALIQVAGSTSVQGLVIGLTSGPGSGKPIIFGSQNNEVARFTSGTIASGALSVAYTTAVTPAVDAASILTAGGIGALGSIYAAGEIGISYNAAAIISATPSYVASGQDHSLSVGVRRNDLQSGSGSGRGALVSYIKFLGVDGSGNQTNGAMEFYLRPNSAGGAEAAEKVASWTAGNSVLSTGVLSLLHTTPSTSTTTGCLTLAGGLGVVGAGYFGGNVNVTGTVRAAAASTQDAVLLQGRAGGTSSYAATITPATLSANRTITLQDASGTVAFLSDISAPSATGLNTADTVALGREIISTSRGSVAEHTVFTPSAGQEWVVLTAFYYLETWAGTGGNFTSSVKAGSTIIFGNAAASFSMFYGNFTAGDNVQLTGQSVGTARKTITNSNPLVFSITAIPTGGSSGVRLCATLIRVK